MKYRRSEKILSAEVGADVVALHIGDGQCYGMENVTAVVWALLSEPLDLDRLCEQLVAKYDVEVARCRQEVSALLEQMQQQGLVETVGN